MTPQTLRPVPAKYTKATTYILWSIFFFPVALWLMWRDSRAPLRLKQCVTGLVVALILINGIYQNSPTGRAAQAVQDKADAAADAQQKIADAQQKRADALAAIPEPQRRFPTLAKFPAILTLVDKQTNDSAPLPKLRSFKYDPQLDMISVEVNMDQNLTTNMTDTGVKMEMADLYQAIYHDDATKPKLAEVRVFGPLEDKFGHTTQDLVYGTAMDRATADQVNWSAEKSELEMTILPGLWTPYYNFKNSF